MFCMSQLPKIAIVGRPNVGKSALFNRICKKRIAIVDETEGVTRDRLYYRTELFGRPFEVIDTGGIDPGSKADFNTHIKRQAEIAIEEADGIIFVVDGQVGVTTLDESLAKILHRTNKPVCLAVNKIDSHKSADQLNPFHRLGFTKLLAVSATQNWHIAELLELLMVQIPQAPVEPVQSNAIRLAIVGRPNVGKSSLVNTLLNEERCVVSPIPGTTRDSIDVSFTVDNQLYTLVDTAGIRKKGGEHEALEKFAAIRTEQAIENADICILVLDSREGMTTQEKRIAQHIEEHGKGCVLLFNKWDLIQGFRMEHCIKGIEHEVPFLLHCPKLFISALTGRNVDKIFPLVQEVHKASQMRISTGQLNKFIMLSMQTYHPPMIQGKRLRIYYMAQVEISPPTFILFVNYPNLMLDTYKKYLMNKFRETYGFAGMPLVFRLKGKHRPKENEKPAYERPVHPQRLQAEHEKRVLEAHSQDDDDSEFGEEFDDDMDDGFDGDFDDSLESTDES